MNKIISNAKFLLITASLCLSLTACTSNQTTINENAIEEVYFPSELTLIDNGELDLSNSNSIELSEIYNLIPEEYTNEADAYVQLATFSGDEFYIKTIKNEQAENILAFNMNTFEFRHVANVEDIKSSISRIIPVDDDIYFIAEEVDSWNSSLYLINNGEVVNLSNGYCMGAVKYQDGVVLSEMDNSGETVNFIKFVGTQGTQAISSREDMLQSFLVESHNLSWASYSSDYVGVYTNINDEVKMLNFEDEFSEYVLLKDVYIEVEEVDFDSRNLHIMNYNGEKIFQIDNTLEPTGIDYYDSFIYQDATTKETFLMEIDSKNNAITSTKLNIGDTSDNFLMPTFVVDGNNILFSNYTMDGDFVSLYTFE